MSARGSIRQYLEMYRLLKRKQGATKKEILEQLEEVGFFISERTFFRKLEELKDEFHLEIVYDQATKSHHLKQDDIQVASFLQLMEATMTSEILSSGIKSDSAILKHMVFDRSIKLDAIRFVPQLLDSIRDCRSLIMTYQAFGSENEREFKFDPYFLKEFDGRWYVIGFANYAGERRTYGIDRIKKLRRTGLDFEMPKQISTGEFDNIIGVNFNYSEDIESVILDFKLREANYFLSLPWHQDYKILETNSEKVRIELRLKPTLELKLKILQSASHVEIIAPKWFREEVMTEIQAMSDMYSSK